MKSLLLSLAIFSAFIVKAQDINPNIGHSIYAAGGISHITSHVDYSWTSGEMRLGGNWQVGYEWISERMIGAGFLYDGYFTKGEIAYGAKEKTKEYFTIHYFAPQFAGRIVLRSDRWVLNYSAGLGFCMTSDRITAQEKSASKHIGSNYDYGVGFNASFGAEYRFSRNLGLIMSLSTVEAYINQSFLGQTLSTESNLNGFSRINLNVGLKFHL